MKKYYVATFELTRLAPVLLLYTMPAPLVMFPEAKFYNVSMIKVDQTLDSVSPKFEELANPFDNIKHTTVGEDTSHTADNGTSHGESQSTGWNKFNETSARWY